MLTNSSENMKNNNLINKTIILLHVKTYNQNISIKELVFKLCQSMLNSTVKLFNFLSTN